MKTNAARPYWITALLLALALVLSLAVGSVFLSPAMLWDALRSRLGGLDLGPEVRTAAAILFDLRLPRTLLVALTGAALAGSGAAYQGLFRNPLADPYLIGVASGRRAGRGAGDEPALAVHHPGLAGRAAGGLCRRAADRVGRLSAGAGRQDRADHQPDPGRGGGQFICHRPDLLPDDQRHRRAAPGAGLAAGRRHHERLAAGAGACCPMSALGLAVLSDHGHALNVLQFGDEQAQQLGLAGRTRARRIIIVAASLTTAAAVSFSGIIGFVGLIVPHLVRLVWGGDYRRLLPLSILGGAAFLLLADVLARVVMAPQELPVGIITALAGAPFFLWVLRRARQQNLW